MKGLKNWSALEIGDTAPPHGGIAFSVQPGARVDGQLRQQLVLPVRDAVAVVIRVNAREVEVEATGGALLHSGEVDARVDQLVAALAEEWKFGSVPIRIRLPALVLLVPRVHDRVGQHLSVLAHNRWKEAAGRVAHDDQLVVGELGGVHRAPGRVVDEGDREAEPRGPRGLGAAGTTAHGAAEDQRLLAGLGLRGRLAGGDDDEREAQGEQ